MQEKIGALRMYIMLYCTVTNLLTEAGSESPQGAIIDLCINPACLSLPAQEHALDAPPDIADVLTGCDL